jgi:glucosamine--fructose-6-phosphate aminotransferase (isomerizing)
MRLEALEAPSTVARLLEAEAATFQALAAQLRGDPPRAVLTLGRGSSDHAAQAFAYLAMARLGQLVTSLPMSLVTLYPSRIDPRGLASFAFSQSGQSPDLIAPTRHFAAGGARTVVFVNDAGSPLAQASGTTVALHAGPEHSVAATKSFIAQLAAGAALVAAWERDGALEAALASLPAALARAAQADWSAALPVLRHAERLFVVSRGTGLAVAMEAALKLKETCGIQAEAFSGAELRHGPMALVDAGYPLLVLAPRGPAQAGLVALAHEMRERGAQVLLASPGGPLPIVATAHEDLDPLSAVQSFYLMVEALARERGRDPDSPPHLSKVTRTH